MELQRFSVSANEYEEQGDGDAENRITQKNDTVKTEDIYQTLQYPREDRRTVNPTSLRAGQHCGKNYVFVLNAVNILISCIILVIVGINYSHNQEKEPIQGEKDFSEAWLLHDNVFYLFWSGYSDCNTAKNFCFERNASLAIVSDHNKGWLISRINGKQFLVSHDPSGGSGGFFVVDYEDDEEIIPRYCGIITSDVQTDHGEGFVCGRRMNLNKPFPLDYEQY